MTGAEIVASALHRYGITRIFSVAGDGNLFILQDLLVQYGVANIAATHESGAVAMADAYSRITGEVGFATVTHGPGLTNSITALTEACKNNTSMILVCGDTPISQRFHLQNVYQKEIAEASGAGFESISSIENVGRDVYIAIQRTIHERRPVVLNVPLELTAQTGPDSWAAVPPANAPYGLNPDRESIDSALGAIASSSRPMILAGRGAVHAGARREIMELSTLLGAPVATTLMAKDWFAGEPRNLGIFGSLSTSAAAEVISKADCIVAFGASLNQFTTYHGALTEGKRLVHCDVDPKRINRHVATDVSIWADAKCAARIMVEALSEAGFREDYWVSESLGKALADFNFMSDFPDAKQADTVDIRSATLALDAMLPRDKVLVCDSGQFMGYPLKIIGVPDPGSFVFMSNYGSIGLGMAGAVGASFGAGGKPIVLIVGDGAFMMSGMGEFNTAVRYGCDIVVLLYNDGAYGAEHIQLRRRNMDPSLSVFDWPDFGSLARSLGGEGITIHSLQSLDAVKELLGRRKGPVIVDIHLDPAKVPPLP